MGENVAHPTPTHPTLLPGKNREKPLPGCSAILIAEKYKLFCLFLLPTFPVMMTERKICSLGVYTDEKETEQYSILSE